VISPPDASPQYLANEIVVNQVLVPQRFYSRARPTSAWSMPPARSIEFGVHVVLEAFKYRKDVVLLNAELDATIRPILKICADHHGVIPPPAGLT
jgi:hypothetical protein